MKFKKLMSLGLGAMMAVTMSLSSLGSAFAAQGNMGSTSGSVVCSYDDDDGITTSGVNVRAGASSSYKKLGYLPKGTKVDIEGRTSNGWYKIEYKGGYGYVSGSYIKVYDDDLYDDDDDADDGITTSGVNVRAGASSSYTKIGYLAKGTKVEIEKKLSNGWYKIEYKGGYGYVSGSYIKVYDDDLYDDDADDGITTSGVNVRAGASSSYAKIGYLVKGTKVDIEKKLSNGWYKIEYKGGYGYVSGSYIKVYDDDLYDDDADDGITTSGVNVRAGASSSYAKIGYLAKGTKVDIEKKLSNGWYKIEYKGGYGYVSGSYIKVF